ncbi:hypothetical protein AN478_07015 [Thiohalorhabdus denitrificans]|uniref:Uncharacterized protein n=1 Tax=Thiohalorhabdus denitrificans TaxID=381306 RepID=A0A0P9ECH3_9GAMM|nr:hypothetical protein [Thiohalorhabdus denitrificans]KPV39940.1 hypothetical protein AN478_07015 [Thiohalorhabdus denitrificans]SCY09197.1 hypothetical protein SAMN05661077_1163 [Thiohalorhabdus denitrificans]
MKDLNWTRALEMAGEGDLEEIEAVLPFDANPEGGHASIIGTMAGTPVSIRPNQDAPEEVPEWKLPKTERSWSLADADWLARLLRGEDLTVWTATQQESALDDLDAALDRLRRSRDALPGYQGTDLDWAVASLRLAIVEAERARERILAGEAKESNGDGPQ